MTRNWRVSDAIGAEWWRPEVETRPPQVTRPEAASSAVAFWALMVFSFILLIAPQQLVPALAPFRIALVTGAVAIVAHLVDRAVRHQPVTLRTREMWLAGALLAWAVLTMPLSAWPGESLAAFEFYVRSLAIFWLLANAVTTLKRFHQLAWALSLMCVPLALTAVWNFLSGASLQAVAVPGQRIGGYYAGLTANPNDLALTINLLIPFSVALLLTARRPVIRGLLLATLVADVTAIILTFSRGGFVTLVTIFGAYAWKLRRRPERRWAWLALVVGLACLPLLPSGYLDRLATISRIDADTTGSAEMRWDDQVVAMNLVLANPIIGTGIGTNVFALYEERGTRLTAVHNAYLEYAVELGLPGLVLFVLLLAACVKAASRVQRHAAGEPARRQLFSLAEATQVTLVAFAVAALFHPVAYQVYFYYVAGMAVAVKGIGADERRPRTGSE
jgi:probable O-glycosylation ligase (exosortase A-associated)